MLTITLLLDRESLLVVLPMLARLAGGETIEMDDDVPVGVLWGHCLRLLGQLEPRPSRWEQLVRIQSGFYPTEGTEKTCFWFEPTQRLIDQDASRFLGKNL